MKIAIGSDHGGYFLKKAIAQYLEKKQIQFEDVGCHSEESVDYPDFAIKTAQLISQGHCSLGIMIDGAGIGSCMAANKIKGIRAATCNDLYTAGNAREHNNANMLIIGSMVVGTGKALQIVDKFLTVQFAGGRHERRVNKIMALEDELASGTAAPGLVMDVVNQVVDAVLRGGQPAKQVVTSNSSIGAPRVITEDWLRSQIQKGNFHIKLSPQCIITPLAKDFAREKQIKFTE